MITVSVACLVGTASTHLVKKSVVVSIHLCCPEETGLISPIKSSPHCWNGASTEIGASGRGFSFLFPSNIWN